MTPPNQGDGLSSKSRHYHLPKRFQTTANHLHRNHKCLLTKSQPCTPSLSVEKPLHASRLYATNPYETVPSALAPAETLSAALSASRELERSYTGKSPATLPFTFPFPAAFLCFRLGKSLSGPGMTLPGCTRLKSTRATSMRVESRMYWYASWTGMPLL